MITEVFQVNPFQQNTVLVAREGKALLFDAGFSNSHEVNLLEQALEKHDCTLEGILITHAHLDHVSGLQMVLEKHDVPVWMSHEDLYLWENVHGQAAKFGLQMDAFGFTPESVPSDKPFNLAGFSMLPLFTPGHSPDHLAFYFEDAKLLIAGDAIFRDSIGRTDLYKGDFDQLAESIRKKLYVLPDQTRVLPGHGPETTIGREKQFNQFVRP